MTGFRPSGLNFAVDLDFRDILTNPILDIAARFWEHDRYRAFQTCYRSMRIIDDLVDNQKASQPRMTPNEYDQYCRLIRGWVDSLVKRQPSDRFESELIATLERFRIPAWPWQKLAQAMVYDLTHNGFPTFGSFRRYCEGAAVAPASVFMHLCGVRRADGAYLEPVFDARLAARPLAIFSYLVHIVRDFEKDQKNNLNYFPHDLLERHGLPVGRLKAIAASGKVGPQVRGLMADYQRFAQYYRQRARRAIDRTRPLLEQRYQLSLEIIYSLYLQIFERIDPQDGGFSGADLNPAPDQIQERIDRTIANFRPVP
jgi:phytoene/squalene synthetase